MYQYLQYCAVHEVDGPGGQPLTIWQPLVWKCVFPDVCGVITGWGAAQSCSNTVSILKHYRSLIFALLFNDIVSAQLWWNVTYAADQCQDPTWPTASSHCPMVHEKVLFPAVVQRSQWTLAHPGAATAISDDLTFLQEASFTDAEGSHSF